MMEKEFNLSEKINQKQNGCMDECIFLEDIKEFIRRLKDELRNKFGEPTGFSFTEWVEELDKLAGDALIDEKEVKNGKINNNK